MNASATRFIANMTLASDWKRPIGSVNLHVSAGDLFDAPVEAIVNSEQTDFILARNLDTISGQIHHRYGRAVHDQDRLTHRKAHIEIRFHHSASLFWFNLT